MSWFRRRAREAASESTIRNMLDLFACSIKGDRERIAKLERRTEQAEAELAEAQLVAKHQVQRILELERALRAGNVPEILS